MKLHIKPCVCAVCEENLKKIFNSGVNLGDASAILLVKDLIVAELLICRKEGTKTSRLTSLYNKVCKLKK